MHTLTAPGIKALFCHTLTATMLALSCAGNMRAEKPVEEVVFSGLQSGKSELVRSALGYIGTNKPQNFIPRLTDLALNSPDRDVRDLCLGALKYYNKKEIFPSWVEVLEKTGSLAVKSDIIDFLSDMDDKRLIIPLTRELAAPFYTVRKKSAVLLKKLGDDRMYPLVFSMAENQNPVYRIYALEALFYLHDKRFNSIIMELLKDGNKSVRIYAVNCVQKNDLADALPHLREMASNDGITEVRITAVNALAHFKDAASLNILLKSLAHTDPNLRKASINALGWMNMRNSAHQLSLQLAAEPDDDNKSALMDLLIKFRNPGDISSLKKIYLGDKNTRLRIKAAHALGVIKDDRAVTVLRDGLKDDDYRVRAEASSSLGLYDPKIVSQILIDIIITDKSRYVRSAALFALKRQSYKKSLLPLFNIYSTEKDPVFSEMLRKTIVEFINKVI